MEFECIKSIKELHIFIESWLIGGIDKSKQKFQYFKDALGEEFIIINPNGSIQTKQDIVNDFWEAHGVQPEKFKISILDIKVRYESKNMCMLTYIEEQKNTVKSARISTVIFQKSAVKEQVYWAHLHETWVERK